MYYHIARTDTYLFIGTRENTRLPELSSPFAVRVVSLEHLLRQASSETGQERIILLPNQDLATTLLNKYVEQLDPLQHLIHSPTTRRRIETLYAKFQVGERVEPNQTVLLLSILASIASYAGLSYGLCKAQTFETPQVAINLAVLWLRTSLDILEHVRRSTSATLETVQASVIILFLVFHIEGFSPKVRAILYTALASAKDLSLHRTDDASYHQQAISQEDIVEKEVRRRVWWHLACTDW